MKIPSCLFAIAMITLAGCSTAYQNSYEEKLSDANVSMKTLRTMDSGDIPGAKKMLMTSLLTTICTFPYYADQAHQTDQQKYEETRLAREILDFMLTHQDDFDPRSPSVQNGMRGLRRILTEPDDVKRLTELSEYMEKKKP
jgi:hypothetical protein